MSGKNGVQGKIRGSACALLLQLNAGTGLDKLVS